MLGYWLIYEAYCWSAFCGSFYFVIFAPTDARAGSVLCWVPEPVVRWFIVAVESTYGVYP